MVMTHIFNNDNLRNVTQSPTKKNNIDESHMHMQNTLRHTSHIQRNMSSDISMIKLIIISMSQSEKMIHSHHVMDRLFESILPCQLSY